VPSSIQGPWSLAQLPPAEVAALTPKPAAAVGASGADTLPHIIVHTHPAELLQTGGIPDFLNLSGTSRQYAADADSELQEQHMLFEHRRVG
jgi:hypothetical protein